jgi:hypothetical protein
MPTLTSTQVVTQWIKSLPGVNPALVGPTLPRDPAVWIGSAFWQVILVGGTPNPDLPLKEPVVEVSVWTAAADGVAAPYNRAESLCTDIRNAAYNARSKHLSVAGQDVFLLGLLPMSEPQRVPDVRTNYARVRAQVLAYWSEVVLP